MKTEIKSLTGIRGVAAVSVMIYHLKMHPVFAPYGVMLFDRGYLCVDLFFVLSGFIIAYIYSEKFLTAQEPGKTYGGFLLNRMARVWPLNFVLTLVFSLRLLLNVSGDDGYKLTILDFFANVFMFMGWGFGTEALTGTSWSVSTEVLAYILFPLLLWLAFSRLFWLQLLAAIAGLCVVAMSPLGVSGVLDVVSRQSFLPDLRCLCGFSLGLLAYRATSLDFVKRWLASDRALLIVMVLMAVAFVIPKSDVFIVLLCPLLIMTLYYDGPLSQKLFGNPVAYYLGLISYSIYLWHPILRDMPARALMILHGRGIMNFDLVFIALALITPIIVSHFSYHWIEVKGRDIIRHLFDRHISKKTKKVTTSA